MTKTLRISCIYKIICAIDGKIYIGSTTDLYSRWDRHKRSLRKNAHHSIHLQRAWNKYSEDAFTIEILEECERDSLYEREQYYLDTLKPFNKVGFNVGRDAKAAMRGRKFSPEEIAKRVATRAGYKHTAETRAKISESHIGISHVTSDQTRERISATNIKLGRKPSREATEKSAAMRRGIPLPVETRLKVSATKTGSKLTTETRAKMSAAAKGKSKSPEAIAKRIASVCKDIYALTSPSGEVFETNRLTQFCETHGLWSNAMYQVANGKRPHHKGWKVIKLPS